MNRQYSTLVLCLILVVALGALIADTLSSIIGIRMIVEPKNLLGDLFVLTTSFVINGFIYATPYILFGRNSNIFVLIVWSISAILDAYTTLTAIIFELLLDIDYIDWTLVPKLFDDSINDIAQAVVILVITVAISLTAALSGFFVNQLMNDN